MTKQLEYHAYDADGVYQGVVIATPDQFKATGFVAGNQQPEPLLYPDHASALSALHAWIKTFLAQFVGNATPEEVVSWPGKAIDAAAYIAGTATDKQKALIEIEATARGGTPMELANLIAANAAVYDPIIRAVPGLRRATVVALGAATTSDDREAVLTAAKATAEALLAQVMAG